MRFRRLRLHLRTASVLDFSKTHCRRAFTLVEALIVIGVVGLLMALTIPAVQAAREAARRVRCANNLRQFGIALHQYHAAVGCLPTVDGGHSIHTRLLGDLGQATLYHSINFPAAWIVAERANSTVRKTTVSLFLCPAERGPEGLEGRTNYAWNTGYGWSGILTPTNNGPFTAFGTSLSQVRDGTSTTVAMAEWILGSYRSRVPVRATYQTTMYVLPEEFPAFTSECAQAVPLGLGFNAPSKGWEWIAPGHGSTLYNHDLSIGSNSCTNGPAPATGAWSAGSEHGDWAHVLMLDGSVRRIGGRVPLETWRALGTIQGNENVSME